MNQGALQPQSLHGAISDKVHKTKQQQKYSNKNMVVLVILDGKYSEREQKQSLIIY